MEGWTALITKSTFRVLGNSFKGRVLANRKLFGPKDSYSRYNLLNIDFAGEYPIGGTVLMFGFNKGPIADIIHTRPYLGAIYAKMEIIQ